MRPTNCHSMRSRASALTPAAAHRTPVFPHPVPCTGRGGPASTSGRGQWPFAASRAERAPRVAVQIEAASLQQGGIGLGELLDEHAPEPPMTPQRVMNRRIKGCSSPAELAALVLDEVSNFTNQNNSNALARLAKMYMARTRRLASAHTEALQLQAEIGPAVEALTKRMHQLIRTYEPWDITLSLWAFSQLNYHDEAALRVLCEAAREMASMLKPVDVANTMVAFAYLDYLHTDLLRQIVSNILDNLEDFSPGEVAQVMWGFGRLGCHPGDLLVEELVAAVHRRMQHYSSQELVLVTWSLVRLSDRPSPRFLRDVERTLLQRLPHLATSDICVAVWSLAKLRYKAVRLLDEIPQAVGPRLWTCSNAELCALISGFATAHHFHRVLLDAAAFAALARLPTFSHQEVCVLLWTYGAFHHRPAPPDFGKQIAAALLARMAHFTPQGLAMTVKALAQLQWRSEAVLAELVAASEQKLQAFKPLEMSQLLYGLSSLQCKDLSIFFSVVRRCIAILKNPQHPHYGHMLHHRVINSVIVSCQAMGYVPWTLIDFAESKGIRVIQPGILSSRDEYDEGMGHPHQQREMAAAAAAAAEAAAAGAVEAEAVPTRPGPSPRSAEVEIGDGAVWERGQPASHTAGDHPAGDDQFDGETEDVGAAVAEELALSMGRRFGPAGWAAQQQQQPQQSSSELLESQPQPHEQQQQQQGWRRAGEHHELLRLQQLHGGGGDGGPGGVQGMLQQPDGLSPAQQQMGSAGQEATHGQRQTQPHGRVPSSAGVAGLRHGPQLQSSSVGMDAGEVGLNGSHPPGSGGLSGGGDEGGRTLTPRPRLRRPAPQPLTAQQRPASAAALAAAATAAGAGEAHVAVPEAAAAAVAGPGSGSGAVAGVGSPGALRLTPPPPLPLQRTGVAHAAAEPTPEVSGGDSADGHSAAAAVAAATAPAEGPRLMALKRRPASAPEGAPPLPPPPARRAR